jgi:hypothetical protein
MRALMDRKRDPDYRAMAVYIQKDLFNRFRSAVVFEESTNSEVVERLIEEWLESSPTQSQARQRP